MRFLKIVTALAFISAMVLTAGQASAQMIIEDAGTHQRNQQLDFVGSTWFAGNTTWLGVAGWYGLPIVPDGFIPTLNDSFYLELGAYLSYFHVNDICGGPLDCSYNYMGVTPMGGVRWNFYLTDDWTTFATLKAGYLVGFHDGTSNIGIGGTLGAYYQFSKDMYLRLETGNLGIIQVGISLQL